MTQDSWPTHRPQPSDAYAASVAFFEHSLDGVLFSAPDGRILDANTAACELLGRTKEEICAGGRAAVTDPHDPRWLGAVAERRRTGRFAGPLSFVRGDGTTIELNISSAVFPDAHGDLRSVIVMRASADEHPGMADGNDPAFVDASGVSNRPAFIHLAEQQCHNAARMQLALGFVYIRLERVDERGTLSAPTAIDRREFARVLDADRRWGDVIGRVANDDFAMLVRNDADDVIALINAVYTRIDAHNQRHAAPLHVHVGVRNFVPDAQTSISELLEDAAARMSEHETFENAHHSASAHCFFALDRPGESERFAIVVSEERPELTEREDSVLRLLASRRSYDEIAQTLFVSVNTVKTHVSHVYAKLGVSSRKDAVEKAGAIGLLSLRGLDADLALRREPHAVDFGRIALIAEALTGAQDADEILDIIMMQGLAGLSADRALVAVRVDDTLVPVTSYGYTEESIARFLPARVDADLPLSLAVREQKRVWVSSPEEGIRRFPGMRDMWPREPRAWINAPLIVQGRAYGGFSATFLSKREFSDADRMYLSSLTNLSALALHDLPNRALHS